MENPQRLGRYHVRRKIGEGGMGVVYEGFDPFIARRVALKAIRHQFVVGPDAEEFLHRLQREAQAAGSLNHPNVVAVYDYSEDVTTAADGTLHHTPFIVMEYIEGRELASRFKGHERFTLPEIQRIMGEILDALRYLHSHGVVHRDIKPGNIMMLEDGSVKVADFGIARSDSSTTKVGTIVGSPNYMSPEQFSGVAVDGRCDLYAAGVVLYQFLTGSLPFSGAPSAVMHKALYELPRAPSTVSADVPKGFDSILRRALAKQPDQRFQTAAEFKQAVMAVSDTDATQAVAGVTRSRRVWPSRLTSGVTLGALMGGLALVAVFGTRLSAHPQSTAQPPLQIRAASMTPPSLESTSQSDYSPPAGSPAGVVATLPVAVSDVPAPVESATEPVINQALIAQVSEPPRKTTAGLSFHRGDVSEYRCSDLLQKASLEPLTHKEADALAKGCR